MKTLPVESKSQLSIMKLATKVTLKSAKLNLEILSVLELKEKFLAKATAAEVFTFLMVEKLQLFSVSFPLEFLDRLRNLAMTKFTRFLRMFQSMLSGLRKKLVGEDF
jgi:hypothetical protein